MSLIAAGFGALAVLGVFASVQFTQPKDGVFTTPVGGREGVTFADGTRVELGTDTVLRTRMTTKQRLMWLERGEAYFQVGTIRIILSL